MSQFHGRLKPINKNPNEKIIKALENLKTKAEAKDSNAKYQLGKAIKSLKLYPIPITDINELIDIKNTGEKTIQDVKREMTKMAKGEDNCNFEDYFDFDDRGWLKHRDDILLESNILTCRDGASKSSRKRKNRDDSQTRAYKPRSRTGAYAILITLYEHYTNENQATIGLTKSEIIEKAQKHCDSSFTSGVSASKEKRHINYTAWNGMKTLIDKSLVEKCGHGNQFHKLTDTGIEVADGLKTNIENLNFDHLEKPIEIESVESVIEKSKNLTVCLIVDKRETCGKEKSLAFRKMLFEKFEKFNDEVQGLHTEKLEIEERCLTVGDFCWTVTDKNTKNEYLLDTIIERKAANDLAISITEKRLVDQKERLKLTKCKNPIYMIETGVNNKELEMQRVNCKALRQQISNFSYCDNFQIIEYHNDSDACDYLLSISLAYSKIKIELDKLQPFSIIENLTAGCLVSDPEDLWMQQLMCVNGVSFEKAEAIVEKWSSCKVFRTALKRETNPEKMVKDVKYTTLSYGKSDDVDSNKERNVGAAVAKQLAWYYL